MNCTGLHSDFHDTLEQSRQAMAKVARLASESQAECERMQKRIETLEGALKEVVRCSWIQGHTGIVEPAYFNLPRETWESAKKVLGEV